METKNLFEIENTEFLSEEQLDQLELNAVESGKNDTTENHYY